MPADAQLQLRAEYPATLDRCWWCGTPRVLHGADRSCGRPYFPGGRALALLVTLGGLLAVLGVAALCLFLRQD